MFNSANSLNLANSSLNFILNNEPNNTNLQKNILSVDSPDEFEFTFDFFYEYSDYICRY